MALAKCLLPEVSATNKNQCVGNFKRFRFDPATNNCVKFTYGGCGGTENRFYTLTECVNTCKAENSLTAPRKLRH